MVGLWQAAVTVDMQGIVRTLRRPQFRQLCDEHFGHDRTHPGMRCSCSHSSGRGT